MPPLLTVCLGFREWYVDHLARCLESLRLLDERRGALEIVVVNTGSDDSLTAMDVEIECHRWNALLVHSPQPEWSRSYALNLASRYSHARAEWFLFTDADMIFASNWLIIAEEYLREKAVAAYAILTRSRDLPTPGIPIGWRDFDTLLGATEPHSDIGQGGGMLIRKDWFRKVRGFDETYRVWGCEDNDLVVRASIDSRIQVSYLPGTFVAHQWHRRDWPTPEQFAQVERNRTYFKAINFPAATLDAKIPIIRNPDGWAGQLEKENRDATT